MTRNELAVAVDVGNSAVKVVIAKEANEPLSQRAFLLDQSNWIESLCRWVRKTTCDTPTRWIVSTVNRRASVPLNRAVDDFFSDVVWRNIGHEDVPIRVDVDFPDRVGIDRIIGAHAAANRHPAPLVVVDVGSAVTVDSVGQDESGHPVFEGGAIFPGIRLQHAALEIGTENLKRPETPSQPSGSKAMLPGKNTEQAIRLGVIASVAGAVERLTDAYSGEPRSGSPRHLILTGGDGSLLSLIHISEPTRRTIPSRMPSSA